MTSFLFVISFLFSFFSLSFHLREMEEAQLKILRTTEGDWNERVKALKRVVRIVDKEHSSSSSALSHSYFDSLANCLAIQVYFIFFDLDFCNFSFAFFFSLSLFLSHLIIYSFLVDR